MVSGCGKLEDVKAVSIKISSITHATEDIEKVLQAVFNVCPEDFPRKVQTDKAKGHYGNEIVICNLVVRGGSKAERFLDSLWRHMSNVDRNRVCDETQVRVDESGKLHLRLDKQEALRGRLRLQDNDVLKIEILFKTTDNSAGSRVEMVRKRIEQMS